ncbi:DCC1-like thiol-disulfide oxidoreductase family protein [Mesorhizobium sp. M0244]|uniref:thiol-disulfide oxidoreductase DCC family protein n=1 Tax=Mesorhizobium sp. M0244 TaxID=2956926 RepID=UPI0033362047
MAEPLLTVWYNTRCPVCDAGISRQKRRLIEAIKAGRIEFRDINAEPAALAGYRIGLEDIRRRLHATDAAPNLRGGADVAIAVWRATPGEGWLARLFGNPAALPLTRYAYDRFADLLYAWNRRKGRW